METIPGAKIEMTKRKILQEKRSVNIFFILIGLIALGACSRFTIFEQSRKMTGEKWHKDSVLTFYPVIEDTAKVMNLGFSLKHSGDYPYSNLWLFIDVESPSGTVQTDTMEYFLAEPDGQWIGKGSDKSCTVYWLYKQGVKLARPGKYQFIIRQGMRKDELDGIQEFSIWIEEAESVHDGKS
jgi:gliding motility-associated lipoprotein GldH